MNFKKSYLVTTYLLLFTVLISFVTLMYGCKPKPQPYKLTGNVKVDGENLVQLKCTRCHALTPVDALPKNVWLNHVLVGMAPMLNISTYGSSFFKSNSKDTTGASIVEWLAIVDYYRKMAPDTLLPAKKPVPLTEDWAGFTLKKPAPLKATSFTTTIAFNSATKKLYSADAVNEKLYTWDTNLKADTIASLPSAGVDISFDKDETGNNIGFISAVGRMAPIDFPNGKVIKLNLDAKDANGGQTYIASDLPRPVQTLTGDFNKDGLNDVVVCGQGNKKGGVYLLKQNKDKTYTQQTILDKEGAVQAVKGDFNKDGWPDVMVLTGTGDEGLWLLTNDQKGGFTTRKLLTFPPTNSSTSFQLADMDHDGNPDLVYTCGYNYHDSRILKPYHGLYIFTNTGNWNFKQKWFYPINGCTKAIAADFDGDGDLDIATIAFFADMQNTPAEEFIYFEQTKSFDFKPHAVPVSKYGRWMCMDVADLNNDGKLDIVLGNYANGFMFIHGLQPQWDRNLPLIVLENHMKK
ncbi:VCBS repeat-containing protein [Mucilaginibacter sp.]|uniref:FG-GAP repeat domain-containing protein n=1 Tax=Mucilaginibacter sp. TaxID=1882438 RepID=UPI0025CF7566|nr:VCBS repeat-containing protein [Mucilaginibacter sp.]